MGVGMILAVAPDHVDAALVQLRASGEPDAHVIGRIASASGDAKAVRYER
jgi:phosphoribosylaminoimidazole (AIR) synthetase